MNSKDSDLCQNCGWPAENCGLVYLASGELAEPYQFDYYEIHVGPGCQVCYALQAMGGQGDLLNHLARRRQEIDAYRAMILGVYQAADEAHRRLLAWQGGGA